jgi:hypothetical protein
MRRIHSPFRPSARPDSSEPAFPPSALPTPPIPSSADCHQPFGLPCRLPTRESVSFLCVPTVSGRLPCRAKPTRTDQALDKPGCFTSGILFARASGSPGVLLDCFPRVAAESTECAVLQWSGLPTVLRPRPRASCLYSIFVHQPAFLRPASFIQPLRD